ncbi:MAG: hypothetical protein MI919_39715, partial [Holophagales bacterium]|nr:hypothetical protein [Holophagales bacterium]
MVNLDFTGITLFDADTLRARLPLERGEGFHPLLLEDSLNVLRTLYEEEGYPRVAITPHLDWDPEGTLVDIRFDVAEGPLRQLDRLVLRGLHRTRAELVRRHARLRPGDVLSRRRLLRAERDLYRLGIFSEVDVSLLPSSSVGGGQDVLIRVEEGRPWRISYGVSYHSDDGIGGLFGLGRTNIAGRGGRLQLDLRASENDQRLRLIYDQPSLGDLRLPLTASLFGRDETRPSYRVEESGLRLSITRDFERLRLGLLYDYRLVELLEEVADPALVEREDS